MGDTSPAFQFYPKDFLTDVKQIAMSLQEVGAYWRLCCHCWLGGNLPMDLRQLARLAGASNRQMKEMWPSIGQCFVERDGVLIHKRLEREREKQNTYRQRQSDKGKASAAMREKLATARATEPQPDVNRGSTAVQPDPQPKLNSSSPSAFASPPKNNLSVSPEVEQKAGKFLEKYPHIYAEERRGAHFQLKPVLHFMTACEIVQGWPDERRLELMFRTFCRLPSTEKMAWPGTPAQFLHLAPELDAKLREAGV